MTGEVKKEMQATHDLGVTQMWLHLDINHPEWADAWRGEDLMAPTRRGQKLPDGFIVDQSGSPGPYLELFGRPEIPNSQWTIFGDQVERRLF